MIRFFLAVFLFILPAHAEDTVARLHHYLEGTFETGKSGAPDHVTAIIEPVFENRTDVPDGPWMLFSMKPASIPGWMQAFYRLRVNDRGETVIESWRIWDTPYAPGADRMMPGDFSEFDLSTATYLEGCDVVLTLDETGVFHGGHAPKGACANRRQGANYVWAKKWFAPDAFMFWENGYDVNDNIIWGPTEAGYTFTRAGRPN